MARRLRLINERELLYKKRKKSMLLWTLFVTALFILGTFASVMLSPWKNSESELKVFNHTFVRVGEKWNLKYEGKELQFTFLPNNIITFNISQELFNILKNSPYLFFSTNKGSELVRYLSYEKLQISRGWGRLKPLQIIQGFTEAVDGYYQIGCENSSLAPVLIFTEGNKTEILKLGEKCYQITIDFNNPYDLVQFFDLLGYFRLGILDLNTYLRHAKEMDSR